MKLIKANTLFFPFLVFSTYAFIILESYSYIGVLRRFILVDSRFLILLAMISTILLIGRRLNSLCFLTFKINKIIFILSLIAYLVMQFLESLHFHNYVFSTYHIQPTNFFYIVVFAFLIFIISRLLKQKLFALNTSVIRLIITTVTIFVFINGLVKTVDAAMYSDVYILTHLNSSYDYKMAERWGIYYDYMKFVKANTPEKASILIPPQELPWYSTGNRGLDLYFLFPRNLDNGSYNNLVDLKKYDYILLSWGEWNEVEKDRYGWPKEKIMAEKIIYFDPATKLTKEKIKDYDPKDVTDGVWGLIKIKK